MARPIDPRFAADEAEFQAIWERVKPFTMTSLERGFALYNAVRHILATDLPGAFVECGVWRGGSALLMAETVARFGAEPRRLVLFDTFSGMTAPSPEDVDYAGRQASELLAAVKPWDRDSHMRAEASLDEVRQAFERLGHDPDGVDFVVGDVRQTLPDWPVEPIALMRLDTDFAESTRACLHHLYPHLVAQGVVIIDDYGHWRGARKAVDEYFAGDRDRPLLWAVDYTGRVGLKPTAPTRQEASHQRYDYHPPGLVHVDAAFAFPHRIEGDPAKNRWPHLRRCVPHIWYNDSRDRSPNRIGTISHEEAQVLYNIALRHAGRRALEIGAYFGWSTAHLALAGVHLDSVDPSYCDAERADGVAESLQRLGVRDRVRLICGRSPHAIPDIARSLAAPYALVFIDGDHEGEAPRRDAEAVLPFCAEDAAIVFHDVNAPAVANAARFLQRRGWHIQLVNTMQIMAVATTTPSMLITHVPDPNVPQQYPDHLADLAP